MTTMARGRLSREIAALRSFVEMTDDRRERAEDDYRRILDAAWKTLRRSGYEGVKLRSVLRAADVPVGRFYRRFAGQDGLLLALLREELRRATTALHEQTRVGTPTERVTAWVDAVIGLAFQGSGARAR